MNEACDRCGPAVRAAYRVERRGELYLCMHCASQQWAALSTQGWIIWPAGLLAVAPQASEFSGASLRTSSGSSPTAPGPSSSAAATAPCGRPGRRSRITVMRAPGPPGSTRGCTACISRTGATTRPNRGRRADKVRPMSRAQLRVVVTAYDRPDGLAPAPDGRAVRARRHLLDPGQGHAVRDVRPGYGRPAWPARSIGS